MFNAAIYNVTKKGLCTSEKESLPIGNGDIGANVWIDTAGVVQILLSKTDSFSESGNLLKVGLVRLHFTAPVFVEEEPDTCLNLSDGTVTIRNSRAEVKIAAFRGTSLVAARFTSSVPAEMTAETVIWRKDIVSYADSDDTEKDYKDSADVQVDDHTWYHFNQWSYAEDMRKNQHMRELRDYIKNLCFAASYAACPTEKGSTLYIAVECGMVNKPESMVATVQQAAASAAAENRFEAYLAGNAAFWQSYFGKYYIHLTGTPEAENVSRLYTLQKYMSGCANRGKMPIKFNGSIFCVTGRKDAELDYDFRRWGGNYWAQNTRLIYWNMLYSGDFEGMKTLFDFLYDRLPALRENAWARYHIDGALLPETVTIHGSYSNGDYGTGQEDKEVYGPTNPWVANHFNAMLEYSYMMLSFLSYAGEEERGYFDRVCYPFIHDVLVFFRERFPVVDGKMLINHTSSLETWWDCDNNTPDIAGLMAVIEGLRELGLNTVIDPAVLPELPREIRGGKEVIAPCGVYYVNNANNCENPELYTVFPYFLYHSTEGLEQIIQDTYDERLNTFNYGWSQNLIQAALLLRREKCEAELPENFARKAEGYFFDAIFGPNFDWMPDQCHGSSNSIALRMMLLQDKKDKVLEKPCLPETWRAEFSLPVHGGRTVLVK